jgi:hypothetical protein
MIDTLATLRTFLLAQTALTTLTTQIYAGRTLPPKGYVAGSKAICFNGRGGGMEYNSVVLSESFTFKCYGNGPAEAMTLYRTLVDVLHDKHGLGIRNAQLEVSGYPLQDPDTEWDYVLVFFRVFFSSGLTPA